MAAPGREGPRQLHQLDAAEVRKVLRRQGAVLERDQPIAATGPTSPRRELRRGNARVTSAVR